MPEPESPAPGEAHEQASGRSRLFRSLSRPARTQLVVAVILALVGFAAVTQVQDNETDETYAGLREQDLIDVLNGLAGARQRAEAERTRLEATRDDLRSTTSRRQAAVAQAENEADTLAVLAGLVPVTGSGVRITISEEPDGRVGLGSMLDVVQELRTVGAEAMQINGEVRIVAQTAFEATEEGFEVDGVPITAPYVVDVIGEPGLLASAISFIGGPRAAVQEDGGDIEVEELGSLDVEAVREP